MTRFMPSLPQPTARLRATLLASPIQANVCPSSLPTNSRIVYRSASAWQGWPKSVRPLMTAQVQCLAISTTVWWRLARTTTTSAYSPSTRAKSAMLSRLPKPTSLPRNIELPPRWAMPASKLTRVRSDGFSNSRAIIRPGKQRLAQPVLELALEVLRDGEDAFDFRRGQIGQRQQVSHRVAPREGLGIGDRD